MRWLIGQRCSHDWGWPRRRGDRDVQVCTQCGAERESSIQFMGSVPKILAGERQTALPDRPPAPYSLCQ
jgi:hypothetical protein